MAARLGDLGLSELVRFLRFVAGGAATGLVGALTFFCFAATVMYSFQKDSSGLPASGAEKSGLESRQ